VTELCSGFSRDHHVQSNVGKLSQYIDRNYFVCGLHTSLALFISCWYKSIISDTNWFCQAVSSTSFAVIEQIFNLLGCQRLYSAEIMNKISGGTLFRY